MTEIHKVAKDNLATYEGFLSISKILMICIALVLIAMALFLV